MIGLSVPAHRLILHLLSYTLKHDFFIKAVLPISSFTLFKDSKNRSMSDSEAFAFSGTGVGTGVVVVILVSLVKVKAFA